MNPISKIAMTFFIFIGLKFYEAYKFFIVKHWLVLDSANEIYNWVADIVQDNWRRANQLSGRTK